MIRDPVCPPGNRFSGLLCAAYVVMQQIPLDGWLNSLELRLQAISCSTLRASPAVCESTSCSLSRDQRATSLLSWLLLILRLKMQRLFMHAEALLVTTQLSRRSSPCHLVDNFEAMTELLRRQGLVMPTSTPTTGILARRFPSELAGTRLGLVLSTRAGGGDGWTSPNPDQRMDWAEEMDRVDP